MGWNGTVTSMMLSLNPAIQRGVYEMLKRRHLFAIICPDFEYFTNALLAKVTATVLTYPMQVKQTLQRGSVKKVEDELASSGIKRLVGKVQRLYRGFESKLLQTCLNSALMFVVYERLADLLTKALSNKDS